MWSGAVKKGFSYMGAGKWASAGGATGAGLNKAEALAARASRAADRSKSWWNNLGYNAKMSAAIATRTIGRGTLSSMARWAMVGAGVGAIRGATDNLIGQDRVSVLGGAMQGAITLGGLRGLGAGLGRGIRAGHNFRLKQKMRKAGIARGRAATPIAGSFNAGMPFPP